MAAEAGGNCEATVPGQLVVKNGVTIIGGRYLLCVVEANSQGNKVIRTFPRDFQRSRLLCTRTT
jgi:hypothetical protein